MPTRLPLVLIGGRVQQLPAADTLPMIIEARPKTGSTVYPTLPGVAMTGSTTRAMVASRAYYQFIQVLSPIVLSEIVCEVTTSVAATVIRMGIDTADLNWQSVARIVDAGTIDSSTTGVKAAAISITLAPGNYSLITISNGAPTVRAIRGSVLGVGAATGLGASTLVANYYVPGTGSALPAAGTQWNAFSGTTSNGEYLSLLTITTL